MPRVTTAEELLAEYAAGERNFQESNLVGVDLVRATLQGGESERGQPFLWQAEWN